ncbi:MAG: tail fiber domain-containing protein, partial [Pyrinomonadaceae bacterium]
QRVNSSPYSIKSLNAETATNTTQLGGLTASEFVQNTSTQQPTSNFNISGNGTAGGTLSGNVVSAATQYDLNGVRILSNAGAFNFFAGNGAGLANTTGAFNAFFGFATGDANTTGSNNSFFGTFAGGSNTTGADNSFFGKSVGTSNSTGDRNSFFGTDSGAMNTSGDNNAFFGFRAGNSNTIGSFNTFFGSGAGEANTAGNLNAFFGDLAGRSNTDGSGNSIFGTDAGRDNTIGGENSFFGYRTGLFNTDGSGNSFFGQGAGRDNTSGGGNSFFGGLAGENNVSGDNNTIVGTNADLLFNNMSFATAIGAEAVVTSNNRVQLGRNGVDTVRVGNLAGAVSTNLCITADRVLAECSSSGRYKENVRSLTDGLSLVRRLRPVTFDWKGRNETDLGLVAEEVAAVDPLLVTRNTEGEIQGVKYDQLTVVLIDVVKEQQQQIEEQGAEIAALKALVCAANMAAPVCKDK